MNMPPDTIDQLVIDQALLEVLSEPTIAKGPSRGASKSPKDASSRKAAKKSTAPSSKDNLSRTMERLKSYVAKCGVRKAWKREFDGLSQKECISKLNSILSDLGMDGIVNVC